MRHLARLGALLPLSVSLACSSSDDAGKGPGGAGNGDASTPVGNGGSQNGGTGGAGNQGGTGSGGKSGSGGASQGGGPSSGGASNGGAGGKVTLSFKCDDPLPDVTAPAATWVNATGNLANLASECGNLGLVSANPCSNMVIAGVAKAGLWGTEDGGKTWGKLGSGAGSAEITNRISAVVYDPDHPGTFWESGIYNGGGVYKTTDNGETFEQLGDVTHTDSVSVDFTDPDRKTLLAGPHETNSRVWRSSDGGKTWEDIGKSLPGDAGYCTATQVLGAANLLVGCNNGGVFHSTGGDSWANVATDGVIPQPLLATDGTLYWPGNGGGLSVSTNSGGSFDRVTDGNTAPGIVGSWYPAELPDGRIVILGKDHLLISSDQGKNWTPIGEPLPYPGGGYDGARGPAYSARTKTFYIWRWDCGNVVLPNAIMSAGFDYTKE